MFGDKQLMTTAARLQHAQTQYESLLIRAGEIIDHVPGHSSSHADESFDSTDENTAMSLGGRHGLQWSGGQYGVDNSGSDGTNPFGVTNEIPELITPLLDIKRPHSNSYHHPPKPPTEHSSLLNSQSIQSTLSSAATATATTPATPKFSNSISDAMKGVELKRSVSDVPAVEDEEKVTIIIALQAEVSRLKAKLEEAISSGEETIGALYQAHATSEQQHEATVASQNAANAKLRNENELLRKQLQRTEKELHKEQDNLMKAAHLIHRLQARQKIITHGLLPQSKRRSDGRAGPTRSSTDSRKDNRMRSSGSSMNSRAPAGRSPTSRMKSMDSKAGTPRKSR